MRLNCQKTRNSDDSGPEECDTLATSGTADGVLTSASDLVSAVDPQYEDLLLGARREKHFCHGKR